MFTSLEEDRTPGICDSDWHKLKYQAITLGVSDAENSRTRASNGGRAGQHGAAWTGFQVLACCALKQITFLCLSFFRWAL